MTARPGRAGQSPGGAADVATLNAPEPGYAGFLPTIGFSSRTQMLRNCTGFEW